jgi:hypothetical protein
MTKAEAGSMGGKRTVELHGLDYMRSLARKGAAAFHARYKLIPKDTGDWAIVYRDSGLPLGKTISGKVFNSAPEGGV